MVSPNHVSGCTVLKIQLLFSPWIKLHTNIKSKICISLNFIMLSGMQIIWTNVELINLFIIQNLLWSSLLLLHNHHFSPEEFLHIQCQMLLQLYSIKVSWKFMMEVTFPNRFWLSL